MEHLYDQLRAYGESGDYPYHMPGHKRRATGGMDPSIYRMDITEIDGFDNLHAPEGLIRDIQERASSLYGAKESFLLVGGSTCGILSAISAAFPMGGHILMARNCHKSAYHGAYLRQLRISYLYPETLPGWEISEPIAPEQVQEALEREPDIGAVLMVSPTYEGRIANISKIAEVVHEKGKILIVDEAHGAHLGLADRQDFPLNSCQQGADLVIHSVHKTLPAMTQTALLHVCSDRVDSEKVKRFLRIYQTSSPSYVLMASVDNALHLVEEKGEELFHAFARRYQALVRDLRACTYLSFPLENGGKNGTTGQEGFTRQDTGKLVIAAGRSGLSGQQIYDILRQEYHLQLEMAAGDYCLAMFTVGDTPEGYERMREALLHIDRRIGTGELRGERRMPRDSRCCSEASPSERVIPFAKAWDMPWEEVPLSDAVGRHSGDFVNLYPPGTPILVPGERFTQALCRELQGYYEQGLNLQGVKGEALIVKCLVDEEGRYHTKENRID